MATGEQETVDNQETAGKEYAMDTEILKQPRTWAIVIPVLLAVWAFGALINMLGHRSQAENLLDRSVGVIKDARLILNAMEESGVQAMDVASVAEFNGLASARVCARAGLISESRVIRGESGNPMPQKNGSILHRETYKLKSVKLEQIARFVDCAERRFSNVNCSQLGIERARSKDRDSWDVTVSFQYLTNAGSGSARPPAG